MKFAIIYYIAPCNTYKSWRFTGTYRLHVQGRKLTEQETKARWFLTLNMEVILSSNLSAHVRTTRRYIPEDGKFHNYRSMNLKTYKICLDMFRDGTLGHDHYLTYSWSWALLEEPLIGQPLKNFTAFMEPEGLIPCSQEPSIVPYPEPYKSNPYHPTLSL
jgi:hypothetical protein